LGIEGQFDAPTVGGAAAKPRISEGRSTDGSLASSVDRGQVTGLTGRARPMGASA
jgi:hypothetical protein